MKMIDAGTSVDVLDDEFGIDYDTEQFLRENADYINKLLAEAEEDTGPDIDMEEFRIKYLERYD